jgi:hypothetical protein
MKKLDVSNVKINILLTILVLGVLIKKIVHLSLYPNVLFKMDLGVKDVKEMILK